METLTLADPVRHLSPVETARRLGVTVKALRLYESKGLVRPLRTSNGWRSYGPEAVTRLHQVLALKRLGLSLGRVGELLAGGSMPLDATLALQEQALAGEKRRVEHALSLIRTARERLKAGDALSIDDLTTLTKETVVSEPLTEAEWKEIFDPLAEKHYTPAQLEALKARKISAVEQKSVQDQWAALIAEGNAMLERGVDPGSSQAIDLARRWKALQDQFTMGDPTIAQKAAAMWKDALADPKAAPRLPMKPELWAFVARAAEAMRACDAS